MNAAKAMRQVRLHHRHAIAAPRNKGNRAPRRSRALLRSQRWLFDRVAGRLLTFFTLLWALLALGRV